ncbi:MAG: hypothetical protein LHW61_06445 [Candidatus Cloacimonetes bacterium]|nr:hypothetical protein [Candidatus Cloacimonadota bacterium]MCB5257870.1 hypothetical protein [Candidatus Cloacimonadota bacterium]
MSCSCRAFQLTGKL